MSNTIAKLKASRYYGLILLGAMLIFFYGIFKILTPSNFGSLSNLYTYLQSSIIYSVGGCGLYFIVVMGLFDFAVGANIVLSSIVGVILSQKFGYAGFILGCLGCGTFIGFLIGMIYNNLNVPSMIVTVGLMLIFESIAVFVAGGEKQTLDESLRFFSENARSFVCTAISGDDVVQHVALARFRVKLGSAKNINRKVEFCNDRLFRVKLLYIKDDLYKRYLFC